MPAVLTWEEARTLMGADALGAAEIEATFGAAPAEPLPPIPFSRDELSAAAQAGDLLILRAAETSAAMPLTISNMLRRVPEAFDPRFLRTVGYQLKEEWGIELEPLAATATCHPGWALVRKTILNETRNLTYDEQEEALRRYATDLGLRPSQVRRRSAVEAIYDVLVYFRARKMRLLERTWDWSSSTTIDGGILNVGGFGPNGIQIFSYSRGIRQGALGVCPTRQPE
jgi:hypothetical protein